MKSSEDLVRYRLSRARQALQDARVMADTDSWNSCVNRLYYACFYAVPALLHQRGLSSSKHSGIRSFFNQHLVKTGEVSKQLARIYNDLFSRRRDGDYVDFVSFEEDEVRPWIADVELFVEQIAALTSRPGTRP